MEDALGSRDGKPGLWCQYPLRCPFPIVRPLEVDHGQSEPLLEDPASVVVEHVHVRCPGIRQASAIGIGVDLVGTTGSTDDRTAGALFSHVQIERPPKLLAGLWGG